MTYMAGATETSPLPGMAKGAVNIRIRHMGNLTRQGNGDISPKWPISNPNIAIGVEARIPNAAHLFKHDKNPNPGPIPEPRLKFNPKTRNAALT